MHTFNSEACHFYTLHSRQERGFITYWSTHDALIIWGLEDVNFISRAALTVRSHQTRMKRYVRMIYMLSQCKDAIDNPAALFAWITWRELSVWGASWKCLTLADVRAALTNQELALAVTSLRAEAENPKQQWRTKLLWLYVGTRSCTILLPTFTKTGIHFPTRLELPAEAPPMTRIHVCCVVNFTREWSEFLARMKGVNSKCSSVQLCENSTIYTRLVWTHLTSHFMSIWQNRMSYYIHTETEMSSLQTVRKKVWFDLKLWQILLFYSK